MININRIINDFENIAPLKLKNEGYNRPSFSKEDLIAREYLFKELRAIGASIKIDGVGNIRGVLKGKVINCKSLIIGSHIDTVTNGGRFDGLLGILCGIEVMRVISENGINIENNLEIIIFSEEEGSNFGSTMLGSKWITGLYNASDLKSLFNDNLKSAYDVIKELGFKVDTGKDQVLDCSKYIGMLELHIEQGIVLDKANKSIGIVEGIFGMGNYRVTISGVGNHAGATPMDYRNDPMLLAASIIKWVEETAKYSKSRSLVATVGKLNVYPNYSNV